MKLLHVDQALSRLKINFSSCIVYKVIRLDQLLLLGYTSGRNTRKNCEERAEA